MLSSTMRPCPLDLSFMKARTGDVMVRAPTTGSLASTTASSMECSPDITPDSSKRKATWNPPMQSFHELLLPTTSDVASSLPKHEGMTMSTSPQSQGEVHSLAVGKEQVEEDTVEKNIREAGKTLPWDPESFTFVTSVLKDPSNQSEVQQMEWLGRGHVAVKRMPISFTKLGHDQFKQEHDAKIANPWLDIGILKHLNKISYPYVPDHLGVYRSCSDLFAVSSLAAEGDLFNWINKDGSLPKPGLDREEVLRPIVSQIAVALHTLHALGITHCNVSMESILLTRSPDHQPKVQLVDFGLACLHGSIITGPRGKPSYIAPELNLGIPCNSHACDVFSLGVVMFCLALGRYPWMSTKPKICKKFMYREVHGFRAFLKKSSVDKVISLHLADLLESALISEPCHRANLTGIIEGMNSGKR